MFLGQLDIHMEKDEAWLKTQPQVSQPSSAEDHQPPRPADLQGDLAGASEHLLPSILRAMWEPLHLIISSGNSFFTSRLVLFSCQNFCEE